MSILDRAFDPVEADMDGKGYEGVDLEYVPSKGTCYVRFVEAKFGLRERHHPDT